MLTNYSDRELIDLYRESRNYQYLTELFTRHSDIVYRTAMRIMQNSSDAEDIMQTSYCKLIVELPYYKHTGSVVGWILQMVVNCCFDRLRSEKSRINREKKYVSERTPVTNKSENDLKEIMEDHLNKLPEIYKVPITLQIIEGLSIKEVSDVLQIPEKTIRSQISRGLEKLKISLQRIGVTASVVSIGDMLSVMQKSLAPAELKSDQYFNLIYQNKTYLNKKLVPMKASKKILIYSTFLAIASVAIIAWFNYSKEIVFESRNIQPSALPKMLSEKWDFEDSKNISKYHPLSVKLGGISIAESKGINSSNGLLIEEKSVIAIDISRFQLPIRISYLANLYVPHMDNNANADSKRDNLQVFVKGNYKNDQKILFLSYLKERQVLNFPPNMKNQNFFVGIWHNYTGYIDDDCIDFWFEGSRSQYLKGVSKDNNKLYLWVTGKMLLDNLTITSIDKTEMPYKENLEEGISNTKFQKGVMVYQLDKKVIGINEKSALSPIMNVLTIDYIEKEILGQKKEVSAIMGDKNIVEWKFKE